MADALASPEHSTVIVTDVMQMAAELEAAKAAAGEQAGKLAEDLRAKEQALAELQARCDAAERDLEQKQKTLEEQEAAARLQTEAAAAASARCSELEAALVTAQEQIQASQAVRDAAYPKLNCIF